MKINGISSIQTSKTEKQNITNQRSQNPIYKNQYSFDTVSFKGKKYYPAIVTEQGEINIIRNIKDKTECVLIPNDMQDVNSYTFEISGKGDFTLYAMERIDRTHLR